MPTPDPDSLIHQALDSENRLLQKAQVPIVTVSATFRKELLKKYQTLAPPQTDVVFSRAHYSMAEAILQQAQLKRKTAYLVDPTNFVDHAQWSKITTTEDVGQLMARHKSLKWLKDKVDTFVRSKLPITAAITPPLLHLTQGITKPLISLHYEAGNILASSHPVVQVLTDPHVRPQYLDPLPDLGTTTKPAPILFTVFDAETKQELLHKAKKLNKLLPSESVVVTGPPVDSRITKLATRKKLPHPSRPLNLAVMTGGLGTNLPEVKSVLFQLAPLLNPPEQIRLFLYACTHRDFRDFYETYARTHNIRIGNLDDEEARIRILYEDSLIDANENLIKYMFPWADGIITKPSGDLAYDAIAAGCFLLLLEPWGEWEQNIQNRLTSRKLAFDLNVTKALEHFRYLQRTNHLTAAMKKAKTLPRIYRSGAANIINAHTQFASTLSKTHSTIKPNA